MKTTLRFVSNLKLDGNLFGLQLSAWCCCLLSKCMHWLYRSCPGLVCFKGGQKRRSLALPSSHVLQPLGSSTSHPSAQEGPSWPAVLLLSVCRCWAGKLFLHPRSGGWINPDGAACAAGGRDAHSFHPISAANFPPGLWGLQRNTQTLEARLDIRREGEFLLGFNGCSLKAFKCEADPR